MPFTFKPLWKQLIDKEMSKKDLMVATGISKSTMDKMGRGEHISLEVLERLCCYFSCNIEDVVNYFSDEGNQNEQRK